MIHTLKNDILKITIDDHGAELKSIIGVSDNTEYLFNGDPKWWKYTSPVLFPIVGKLVDSKYRVDGKEFSMPGHGFGRISDYQCISESSDEVVFALDWNEETLKSYPFKFRLEITYILRKNRVEVIWTVKNVDDKVMYFSIGAHPALKCPIVDGENFEDCYLKFNVSEKCSRIPIDMKSGALTHERIATIYGKELALNYDLFKGDALVFDNLQSDEVSVCSRKSKKSITVKAKGFPFWGIWTPDKGGAPFICIEPWHGHADFIDFKGDISEKDGIHSLPAGESFDAGYAFIIHE
ncbi:MAG: aldose 1-epimerase family protein [Selenomonadaceae bacterium]|nr:aldose 1-epimerase family protein [Selenomonadaceae bacterium]